MSTVAERPRSRRRVLPALLVLLLVGTQSTALAHEIEHTFHLHDAPCALHVAAEHSVMVAAPPAAPAVAPLPVAHVTPPPLPLAPDGPVRPGGGRSPPRA